MSVVIEFGAGKPALAQKIDATLTLLNSADQPIASLQPVAAADVGQTKFSLSGELSATDAVALVVDIRHEGFTRFARRLPIQDSVYVLARLEALTETAATPGNSVSISGATTNGFTLQVTDDNQTAPSMSISIPASSLPAGTQALTAAIKTYDPNNAQDAQYFPGSYADSTGNNLVSVAFNYAEVKTNTGETLQTLAANAQALRQARGAVAFAAPPEPVIINRTIPDSSCATLEKLGDANAELAGFQIPVYTYNPRSGLWDLLGYGTVYTQAGVAVPGDAKDLDCAGTTYVLEIKVTNEIFLSDWWNLDYPLQFNEPIKRCANLHIVNESNEPLAGVHGLITGDSNFASEYFVTDNNGNVNLSLEVFTDDVSTGSFIIWGANATAGNFNLSNVCPAPAQQTVILKRPQLCKIKGRVSYADKPVANLGVFAVTEVGVLNDYWFNFGSTNSEGIYTLDVACDQPYTVDIYFADEEENRYKNIKVDGIPSNKEQSDDGKQVTLTPFVFDTLPFDTTLYTFGYEAETKEGVLIFLGMYDAFPISYDLQLKNSVTGQVVASAKGSASFDNTFFGDESSQWFLRAGQVKIPVALPEDLTNFTLQGFYTDGFGIRTEVDRPALIAPVDEE